MSEDPLLPGRWTFGRAERVGTILEIGGTGDHPKYLVHWVIGDYDSLISPRLGVHIHHRAHLGAVAGSRPPAVGTRASAGTTSS